MRVSRAVGSYLVVHLPVALNPGRTAMEDGILDVLQSTTPSTSSSSVVQVGTLPNFLDQWRIIICNLFVINMVKGHHLHLGAVHYYSIISNSLTLRLLWLIIPFMTC